MARRFGVTLAASMLLVLGLSAGAGAQDRTEPDEPVSSDHGGLFIGGVKYSGGDGDDSPEPGETLTVDVTLVNESKDPARDVRATMSSTTDGVRVVTATATFPDMPVGGSARNTEPFVITIGSDVPTSRGCDPGPRGIEPIPAGDPEPDVDEPAEPGGGDSGSTGTDKPDETAVEEESVAPDEGDGGRPAVKDPAPEDGAAGEPDPSASFELKLAITADGYEGTQFISTQVVCIASQLGAPEPGAPAGDDAADLKGTPGGTEERALSPGKPVGARRAAIPLAALALTTVAALWLRRLGFSRARG